MLKKLISIANELDTLGLVKEADELDLIIRKIADEVIGKPHTFPFSEGEGWDPKPALDNLTGHLASSLREEVEKYKASGYEEIDLEKISSKAKENFDLISDFGEKLLFYIENFGPEVLDDMERSITSWYEFTIQEKDKMKDAIMFEATDFIIEKESQEYDEIIKRLSSREKEFTIDKADKEMVKLRSKLEQIHNSASDLSEIIEGSFDSLIKDVMGYIESAALESGQSLTNKALMQETLGAAKLPNVPVFYNLPIEE